MRVDPLAGHGIAGNLSGLVARSVLEAPIYPLGKVLHSAARLFECADERRAVFRNNSSTVTPQSSQAGGKPISQRECAGFNRGAPLSIFAGKDDTFPASATRHAQPCFVTCFAF